MPTFKAVVNSRYARKDKTYPIKIRVTHKRVKRFIDTGLVASPGDLTKGFRIKNPGFIDETNEIIREYRDRCNENRLKVSQMNAGQLMTFLTTKHNPERLDFIEFGKNHAQRVAADGRLRTAEAYTTALNALKRFAGRETLSAEEITVKFLEEFEQWIRINPIKPDPKGLRSMCRAPSHYLGSIRTLFNEMKQQYNDEDRGVILIPYSPFSRYKVPLPPVTKKRAIPAEIIKKIAGLPDEKVKNMKGSRFNLARDCFILSFCLIGMNSADLYHCEKIRDNKIWYKRKKTRTRRKDEAVMCVYLTREIVQLVAAYGAKTGNYAFIFSRLYATESNFNKAINKGLKLIGQKVGVPDLEFYSARHSWATIALNKCGIDKYTVHAALNHVIPEMKVTDIYIEKDWSVINKANRKVLDYVFHQKTESRADQGPGLTENSQHE